MIDRLPVSSQISPDGGPARHRVLRMVTNDRTAGSIPKWEEAASPQEEIENNLSMAEASAGESGNTDFKNSLTTSPPIPTTDDEEFTFGDLVDMVNPLQHIPVVGHFYRRLTGDEIKPAGKIIGDTIFGGPAGLATGLANVILTKETGRDIAGNTLALITKGERPRLVSTTTHDLPDGVISFADLGYQTAAAVANPDSPLPRKHPHYND